jgi:hypothetical protein
MKNQRFFIVVVLLYLIYNTMLQFLNFIKAQQHKLQAVNYYKR